MGAKLKSRVVLGEWPSEALGQREATQMARTHPDVVRAAERLRKYIVERGERAFDGAWPEDPRWTFSREWASHPEYRELVRERDKAYYGVRDQLMGLDRGAGMQ